MIMIIYSIPIFLIIGEISSQQITYSEAQKVARNFLFKTTEIGNNMFLYCKDKQDTLFYVFNAEKGFVVIAADKRSGTILAFSDKDVLKWKMLRRPLKCGWNIMKIKSDCCNHLPKKYPKKHSIVE